MKKPPAKRMPKHSDEKQDKVLIKKMQVKERARDKKEDVALIRRIVREELKKKK